MRGSAYGDGRMMFSRDMAGVAEEAVVVGGSRSSAAWLEPVDDITSKCLRSIDFHAVGINL